jgi:hypothetical protein
MSFCQSNRGDNALNKVFVKKNHKKFLGKNPPVYDGCQIVKKNFGIFFGKSGK